MIFLWIRNHKEPIFWKAWSDKRQFILNQEGSGSHQGIFWLVLRIVTLQVLTRSSVSGQGDEDVTELSDNGLTGAGVEAVFSPSVSATCRAGVMTINVETNANFIGAVHARDYRRPACTNYGQGSTSTSLNINLLADKTSDNYCGVFVNKVSVMTDSWYANANQQLLRQLLLWTVE